MLATHVESILANTILVMSEAVLLATRMQVERIDKTEILVVVDRLSKLKFEMWRSAKIPSEARNAFHEAEEVLDFLLDMISKQDDKHGLNNSGAIDG